MPVKHRVAKHRARGVAAACAVTSTICVALAAQGPEPAQGTTVLPPNQTIERELSRGQEHRYQLALQAGECVRVIVVQQGIDVVVQTRDPADALMFAVQDEITGRGQEEVDLVAHTAGTYTFVIAPAPGIIVPGSYAIRVGGRRAATAADRSSQEARTLRTVAAQRYERGDFAGVAALLERALTLTEGARGPKDREVADVAAQLAEVYLDARDVTRAEPLYQRAHAIVDETHGRDHPVSAFLRSQLGGVYLLRGESLKAEPLIREGLAVIEKTLGADHLLFVRTLGVLRALRHQARDFEQAAEITRRQLAIMEKIGHADSMFYAWTLTTLGGLYSVQQDARAEDVLLRALNRCETLHAPDENCAANTLAYLAVVARDRGDNAKAETYNLRALALREAIVGTDHPDLIPMLNSLAAVYNAAGDQARALEMHVRALRIAEHTLPPYHRFALLSTGNIASIHAAAGNIAAAIDFQRRADAIVEQQLTLNMAVGSERQKLAFVRGVSERTDRTISMHLREAPGNPDAGALAARVVLQRKGRVLDAMTDMLASARQRVTDPHDQALLDQLNTTIARLARFALNAPEGHDPDAHRRQIKELEAEKRTSRRSRSARVTPSSARSRNRPPWRRCSPRSRKTPRCSSSPSFARSIPKRLHADAYGPPRYAAYVVRKNAAPRGVDLGPAQAIDESIAALRLALRDVTRRDLRRRARALHEQVLAPLQAAIGGARRVLISPDGDLNLVPFDALIDARGRYAIERYAITYLTSGRDLLRMQVPRASRSAPVIVANPLFGEPAPSRSTLASRASSARMAARAVARAGQRGSPIGDDLSSVYFTPLAATASEGRAIKELFPEATLFTGRRATTAALQRMEAPRLLHIASHGFFLHDATENMPPSSPAGSARGTRAMSATVKVENPLLRSGLALAGANLTRDPNDDGILTALEASGLNLWGTKLVTLSACDTGVGEVRNGEGVYGLRRAFVLAGAETLVMSLWPVSDYVTREMMTAYYSGLREGLGRGDALRHAKLAMLKRQRRQHPYYWASFIQSGEWANLDGRR